VTDQGVPTGWYADPNGNPAQRYWDGEQWTEQTRPQPPSPRAAAPGFEPNVMRPYSAAVVWSLIPLTWGLLGLIFAIVGLNATSEKGDRRGRGGAITGLVINIVAIVLFLVLIIANAASSSSSSSYSGVDANQELCTILGGKNC
jgi:hypothetical protein